VLSEIKFLCPTKRKAKVLLPTLTHASPFPTDVCPTVLEAENLEQILVFLQQKTANFKENAHIKELKKYHLQL